MAAFDIEIMKMLKEEYLRLCLKVEHLKELARIDLDLLNLSVDLKNVPDAKGELDKVHELVQALMNEDEVNLQLNVLDELLYCKDGNDKNQNLDSIKIQETESKHDILSPNKVKVQTLDHLLLQLTHSFTEQEMMDAFSRFLQHTFSKVCGPPKSQEDLSLTETTLLSNSQDLQETREGLAIDSQLAAKESTEIGSAANHSLEVLDNGDDDGDSFEEEKQDHVSSVDQFEGNIPWKAKYTTDSQQQSGTDEGKLKTTEFQSISSDSVFVESLASQLNVINVKSGRSDECIIPSLQDSYMCDRCNKTFKGRKQLQKHKRYHMKKDRNVTVNCRLCGKGFLSSYDLRRHQKTHLSNRQSLPCNLCDKRFLFEDSFKEHLKSHSDNQTQENCEQATNDEEIQTLTQLTVVSEHNAKNEENVISSTEMDNIEKTIKCPVCEKVFKNCTFWLHFQTHPKQFFCNTCGNGFALKCTLELHIRNQHSELPPVDHSELPPVDQKKEVKKKIIHDEMMKCPVCDKEFTLTSSFTRHVQCHSSEKPFLCNICGKTFPVKTYLNKHLKVHSETGAKFSCKVCDKSFSRSYLSKHMLIHTGERPYLCSVCGIAFRNSDLRNSHERKHTGNYPHQCSTCCKKFDFPYQLRNHERYHTGESPFPCSKCNKAFVSKTALAIHLKSCTGRIRPGRMYIVLSCTECQTTFRGRYQLALHMINHPSDMQQCMLCNQTFDSFQDLQSHVGSKHLKNVYECSVCGQEFHSIYKYRNHMAFHKEADPFKCPECGKSCTSKQALQLHRLFKHNVGSLSIKCEICGKIFKNKNNFSRHEKIHLNLRSYKCSVCGRTFVQSNSLKVHMWTHREEKRFNCELCGKGFNEKRAFSIHLKSHEAETESVSVSQEVEVYVMPI